LCTSPLPQKHPPTSRDHQLNKHRFRRAEIVLLIICAICVLLNVIEIILFIPGKLGPLTYLTSQVVKTTIWLILFVIGIVNVGESAARHLRGTNSTVAIIEIVVIL